MRTKVIKIGNSRGIRLPKAFIAETQIDKEVELEINDNKIIIKPVVSNRAGWSEAFSEMAANNDDKLIDETVALNQSSWDEEEWEW